MNLPKLLGTDYYIKKLPVTEPGAKRNKIRSLLLLLILVLYHWSIPRQNKKPSQASELNEKTPTWLGGVLFLKTLFIPN